MSSADALKQVVQATQLTQNGTVVGPTIADTSEGAESERPA